MRLGWYWRRLGRMSAREVLHRGVDHARRLAWRRRQVRPGAPDTWGATTGEVRFPVTIPADAASHVPAEARAALLRAAEGALDGSWTTLGCQREDAAGPDWFLDPTTGRRAPQEQYAFRVDHRSEAVVGNVKQVWELSRHHHLTVLAAAWFLTGDVRYAEVVDRQLRSWWSENPFLSGVHWTSGIELGVRLVSWTWIRRLLDGWPGAVELFERNPLALRQIRWHQEYLAAFRSTGSSANNHVVAEAVGQLVASCAFPWFPESDRWRAGAAATLDEELARNTFPSGLNREQASDYHRFVTELAVVAAVEARAAGFPLATDTTQLVCRMFDAAASVVDGGLRGPRQGDGDDGLALLLDGPGEGGWESLLAAGAALFGPEEWWPPTVRADVRSTLLARVAGAPWAAGGRPATRVSHFADAGLTLLRSARTSQPEVWVRCDGGPHGFLSIAAHAHADALSVEVRHGGVEVLVDPGTYCYHGEPHWRSYFRSTLAHNTLELDGRDQSTPGGPFLWVTHASSRVSHVEHGAGGDVHEWEAEHTGYGDLPVPAVHRRRVRLDQSTVEIVDIVASDGPHPCRLAFHLGPSVHVSLEGTVAALEWPSAGGPASAVLRLPAALAWAVHEGESDAILGWYSPAFGRKQPTTTLVGTGTWEVGAPPLTTALTMPSR